MDIQGVATIVTGRASGLGTTRMLAARGAKVTIFYKAAWNRTSD